MENSLLSKVVSNRNLKENSGFLRKTLKISIYEGAFAQMYMSLAGPGSVFITHLAVLLNATPMHFGLLSAISQLTQLFQPVGALITRRMTSRKGMVVTFSLAGRIMTLFLGLIPFVLFESTAMSVFLSLLFVSTALQSIAGNAWIAWISDSVPLRFRGRFFAVRSRYLLVIGLVTGMLAGVFLDVFPSRINARVSQWFSRVSFQHFDNPETGLALLIVFALAAATGIAGILILKRQPEYPKEIETDSALKMLFLPFKDKNFRRLLFFASWWMMAVGIGAPFWQPFMISHLAMSTISIQLYGVTSILSSLFVLKSWGKFVDRFGNKSAMVIAVIMGGFNPFIWVVTKPETFWLVYCEAVTSGMMWAGAGLVAVNFVLAVAPPDQRQIYSGLYGAVSGIAMMITMILSGMLLPLIGDLIPLNLMPEQALFALTGLFRWSAVIPLLWIADKRTPKLNDMMGYFRQYSKVRLTHLADKMLRYLPLIPDNNNEKNTD